MKKLINFYPTLILGYSLFPLVAAGAQKELGRTLIDIGNTLNTIIGLLFAIAVIVFIWGVIQFIASAGNDEARKKAKGIMTWGILGLAIMAAAFGIVNVLTNYFGVDQGLAPTVPSIPVR